MREQRKRAANNKICGSFSLFAGPCKQLTPCLFPIAFDSKTDSKTGRQPWISVDGGRNSIGLWSGWKTLVDGGRRVMPKGGLEPPCPFEHNALNVACLPISPLRRRCPCGQGYHTVTLANCQEVFWGLGWALLEFSFSRFLCRETWYN